MAMIYFVQERNGHAVKIGFSVNPRLRFNKMRADSSGQLDMLAIIEGDRFLESQIHKRFKRLRTHGEWFRDDGSIGRYVRELIADGADVPLAPSRRYKPGLNGRPSGKQLRELGISTGHASELAAGKRLPSLSLAQRIEAATGYPISAWRLEERAA